MTNVKCVFKQCNSQQQAIDLILNEFYEPVLKPCPCCNEEATIERHLTKAGETLYHLECLECRLCFPLSKSKAMLIEKWNRRHDAK